MPDFTQALTTEGALLLLMVTGIVKVWAIVAACNKQLQELADDAIKDRQEALDDRKKALEARDAAEEDRAKLRRQVDSLLHSNETLQAHVEALEKRIQELTNALLVSRTDNEQKESSRAALAIENTRLRSENDILRAQIAQIEEDV